MGGARLTKLNRPPLRLRLDECSDGVADSAEDLIDILPLELIAGKDTETSKYL